MGSSTYLPHRDHLNTVRAMTDGTGGPAERARFTPYGERTLTLSTVPHVKGFIGERHDPETGLIYLNARYYDAKWGVRRENDSLDRFLFHLTHHP